MGASLRMEGVVKNYAMAINFETVLKDMKKFVKKMLKNIFQKVLDVVMGNVNSMKDKVTKLKFAAVEALEEMETELATVAEEEAALLQLQQQNDQEQQELEEELAMIQQSNEVL